VHFEDTVVPVICGGGQRSKTKWSWSGMVWKGGGCVELSMYLPPCTWSTARRTRGPASHRDVSPTCDVAAFVGLVQLGHNGFPGVCCLRWLPANRNGRNQQQAGDLHDGGKVVAVCEEKTHTTQSSKTGRLAGGSN
jgi:hypothetical protein